MAVNTNPPVQLQNGTDQSQKDAFINENFRALADSLNPFQISDGNTNIVSIGQDSTGNYSLKVAKEGYDAYNATDDQLVFNSNQNVLKVVNILTIQVTVPPAPASAVTYSTVVAHGLSYIPAVLGYAIDTDGNHYQLPLSTLNPGIGLTGQVGIFADATNITLYAAPLTNPINAFFDGTYTAKVYLLQESAN